MCCLWSFCWESVNLYSKITSVKDYIYLQGDLSSPGTATITNTLSVGSITQLSSDLTVNGNSNFKGNLDIAGVVSVNGNIYVKGDILAAQSPDFSVESGAVIGGQTIGGGLNVKGTKFKWKLKLR